MDTHKKITNYVSEIDGFLHGYDKKHPEQSLSQQKEISKHQRVYRLRDDSNTSEPPSILWEEF